MKKILFLFVFLATAAGPAFSAPLPPLKIEKGSVTVSGISSGAFMATQLQVALSSRIAGSASVAGGIYACALGDSTKAQTLCMISPGTLDANSYVALARSSADKGEIDPLANLSRARLYLFHSAGDRVVKSDGSMKLQEFFAAFTPAQQIVSSSHESAGHGFLTLDYGVPCERAEKPWINNCGRDLAGEILLQLYPGLKEPTGRETPGDLVAFDQRGYSVPQSFLLPEGKIYVPKACRTSSCRLHIALHGCAMSTDYVQDQYALKAGYNRWADANRIAVLFPQADKGQGNPFGCWDWYGFTGKDYALKTGKQIRFISAMLDALTGAP